MVFFWFRGGQGAARLVHPLKQSWRCRATPMRQPLCLRNIFIQTETTPNSNALKFLPGCDILPASLPRSSIEYASARATVSAPYPSGLAAKLFDVPGLTSVFYGPNFITITKDEDTDWSHIRAEVFSLITETVNGGDGFISSEHSSKPGRVDELRDSLAPEADDDEVVGMIKELLETRIRPSIQEDGGDVEFKGFEGGVVSLKLTGACRTCDSSTVTLKTGIESMLKHYVEEVKSVRQVLDPEEAHALAEFEKFDRSLEAQKSKERN